ncbi:hypothetical protein [Paenibacillus sp. Root52]|uniref:hypothetical protein n=1 Tax=Paenibacillus sp. Root52 TaxID=1736552 RepID=UPI0026CF6906
MENHHNSWTEQVVLLLEVVQASDEKPAYFWLNEVRRLLSTIPVPVKISPI